MPLFYVVPIESILGKLSVVQAGDTGTIPFEHIASSPSDVDDLCELFYPGGRADSEPGSGDGTGLWHTNPWALGWSRDIKLLPRRPRAAVGKRCTADSTACWPGRPEPGPCNRDGSASGSRCTKRVSPRRARTAEEPGPCRGIRHNEASRECLRQSERLATDCSTYYAPE